MTRAGYIHKPYPPAMTAELANTGLVRRRCANQGLFTFTDSGYTPGNT